DRALRGRKWHSRRRCARVSAASTADRLLRHDRSRSRGPAGKSRSKPPIRRRLQTRGVRRGRCFPANQWLRDHRPLKSDLRLVDRVAQQRDFRHGAPGALAADDRRASEARQRAKGAEAVAARRADYCPRTRPQERQLVITSKTQPCAAQVIRSTRGRSACPERDKPWVLAAAVLGSTMAFVDESVVNVALPTIEADLGTTLAAMQWVINAYTL